jgi:hypothetical protein
MSAHNGSYRTVITALGLAVLSLAAPVGGRTQQPPSVSIGPDDVGGTVLDAKGPEAGVWVIAETRDLPVRYIKIVVTDDQGRYVIPGLPKANYDVWVRGYGLVDSPKVRTVPGKIVNLTAVLAPNAEAAAQYYPADYWFSMMRIPDKQAFAQTTPRSPDAMPANLKSQAQWIDIIKTQGCNSCHQLGNLATRVVEPELRKTFKTSLEAWARRVQSGPASEIMARNLGDIDAQRALALFADWTDRIAAGELPKARPHRPQGLERNVVVTLWDWSGPKSYVHDEIATDKRHPTVNAYGKLYGSPEDSSDYLPMLDPVHHVASQIRVPVRDPKTPDTMFIGTTGVLELAPSLYWGSERIWKSQSTVHNVMFDAAGRLWMTARIRPPQTPGFCRAGSDLVSAKLFPVDRAGRQAALYDPKTNKFTLIDTCFTTHHLVFAEDANNTLWFSAGGPNSPVVGWLDTKKFLETGDEAKSQGWTALVVDTAGTGRREGVSYTEPGQPLQPGKDMRIVAGFYGIAVSPVDGTVWGSVLRYPGGVVRLDPGSNPPATALAEYYEVPFDDPRAPVHGFGPRGLDIDRHGVVWLPLASGHLASFDRRKCKGPLNGPVATGKQCPEGWTLYRFPAPQFENVSDSGSAESGYQVFVDQFNTLGLGPDVPIATGNTNDALEALVNGKWVELRVPYPMGFFAKGADGRIDDPAAGWKGRGIWSTYGGRTPQHIEGGKGQTSKVVYFQLRPDPLAH